MTVGRLAAITGVAAKTIRYYEQVGVLPAPRRTPAGYRQYDERDAERLRFVRRARALGLSLRHVKTLTACMNGGPPATMRPRVRALVRGQLSAVQERIREFELLRRELQQVLQRLRSGARRAQGARCRCLDAS